MSLGLKDQIAHDDDADRKAGPDGERRRHIWLAVGDLRAGKTNDVLHAVADRPGDRVVIVDTEFRANVQHCGNAGASYEPPQ